MASDAQIFIYRVLGEDATYFSGHYAKAAAPAREEDGDTAFCAEYDTEAAALDQEPALPVLPGKVARCTLAEALFHDDTGQIPEPLMWVQGGLVARLDPDGEYLCAEHMAGWQCEECGAIKPTYGLNGGVCASCAEDMQTAN